MSEDDTRVILRAQWEGWQYVSRPVAWRSVWASPDGERIPGDKPPVEVMRLWLADRDHARAEQEAARRAALTPYQIAAEDFLESDRWCDAVDGDLERDTLAALLQEVVERGRP